MKNRNYPLINEKLHEDFLRFKNQEWSEMVFGKNGEEEMDSKELLKKASRSKREELMQLLKLVEEEIKRTEKKDDDLLFAKRIITSRLASMKSGVIK
ncbi:MAG: hypothetical protein ACXVHT_12020 [Methanobacterium sp.]